MGLKIICQLILKGKLLCSSEKEVSYLWMFSCDYIQTRGIMFYNNLAAFLCCIPRKDFELRKYLNENVRESKLLDIKTLWAYKAPLHSPTPKPIFQPLRQESTGISISSYAFQNTTFLDKKMIWSRHIAEGKKNREDINVENLVRGDSVYLLPAESSQTQIHFEDKILYRSVRNRL